MPLKSRAQEKWMWANHPAMAKRWEAHTDKSKPLPARVHHHKKGELMQTARDPLAAAALIAAQRSVFSKFAADTNLSRDEIVDLAAFAQMTPLDLVKQAYADPAAFNELILLKQAASEQQMLQRAISQARGPERQALQAQLVQMQARNTAANRGIGSSRLPSSGRPPAPSAAGLVPEAPGLADRLSSAASGARGRVGELAEQLGGHAGAVTDRVAEGLGAAGAHASQGLSSLRGAAGRMLESPAARRNLLIGGGVAGVGGLGLLASRMGGGSATPSSPPPTAANIATPPGAELPSAAGAGGEGGGGSLITPGRLAGGAALAAGAYGLHRLLRRRREPKAAFDRVLARAIRIKQAADASRLARQQMNEFLDATAARTPIEKQACLRTMQTVLAAGQPFSLAVKMAYPKLSGEQRGIVMAKLADLASAYCQKKANMGCGPSAAGMPTTSAMSASGPPSTMGSMMTSVGA